MNFGTVEHTTAISKEMLDSLGRYLDNLDGAVTNGDSTFEQYSENFKNLANIIVTLTDMNKNRQAELRSVRKENATQKK